MWSVEYVQVPDDSRKTATKSRRPRSSKSKPIKIETHDKSARERLQDFKNPDYLSVQETELGSSAESENHLVTQFHSKLKRKDELLDVQQECNSMSSTSDQCKDENDEQVSEKISEPSTDITNRDEVSTDKSSSTAEYVIINDSDVIDNSKSVESVKKFKKPKHHLREGFKWQRQLVFRSKLTMHTAFERKDNKEPAAITSIAISKDHKSVYVGDSKGRIYSWSVTDQPGRVIADHWMKDEGVENCLSCGVKFSFSERRHHCRNCGHVLCSKCSRYETDIRRLKIFRPVRVCQSCYNSVKTEQIDGSKS